MKEMKRMKRILIFLAVLLLLVGCGKKLSLQEYLDLGDKYLTESNYEKAIVAFTKAIELEPKAVKAYEGLADVYIKTEKYAKAKKVLENGISVYKGLSEEEQTDEFKQIYETLLKLREEVETYLREQDSLDEEPKQEAKEEKLGEYQELVDDLTDKMKSQDRESIWELQSSDEYQNFITKLDHVISRDCKDGNWLLIYPCGHCYYGGMKGGKRSGQGIWCAYDYIEGNKDYDSCTWENDYPNGTGEEWSVCLPVPEDLFYTQMNLKDGLYHGTIQENCTSTYEEETFQENYTYECSEGIAAEVADLHADIAPSDGKERYCIYSDDEFSQYAVRGYKKGILHARKGIDAVDSMKAYTQEEIQDAKQSVEDEIREWEDEAGANEE